MKTEYKNAPVSGVYVEDEGDGIITALVSVTGIVDNVKDIIEPGAYRRTLGMRKPKGIWHHTWTEPIAKTLDAKELMPGDPGLPKTLPDGKPWPREAGALKIRMKFNLATPRGKTAYEDVKFFGPEQEWSIGYNVPTGGARKDEKGIRHITDIDLFEYSPVLFGAMPHARTMNGVKEAQLAFKDAMGVTYDDLQARIEEWEATMSTKDDKPADTTEPFVGDEAEDNSDAEEEFEDEDESLDELADDFEDDEDEEPTKAIKPGTLRKAIDALTELLEEVGEDNPEPPNEDNTDEKGVPAAYIEAKAMEYLTLTEAVDGYPYKLDGKTERLLSTTAMLFDDAVKVDNSGAMERAATSIMDILEELENGEDDDIKCDALAVITQTMSDLFGKVSSVKADATAEVFTFEAQEFQMAEVKSRQMGWPVLVGGATISRKARQRAFFEAMDDDTLIEVADYLAGASHERAMKRLVDDMLDARRALETKRERTQEEVDKLGAQGKAFKNGNGEYAYPVEDKGDLDNAVRAYGRCMPGDKDRLKAWLMKMAKELNAEDMIPPAWSEKSFTVDLTQLKSWGLDAASK